MEETRRIVNDVLRGKQVDPIVKTITRLTKEIDSKYVTVNELMEQLNNTTVSSEGALKNFVLVMDEMYADGVQNWGRIVAMCAFSLKLKQRYNDEFFLEKLSCELTNKINEKMGPWILENGGWRALIDFFDNGYNKSFTIACGLMNLVVKIIHDC
jgi:hypothetical protein